MGKNKWKHNEPGQCPICRQERVNYSRGLCVTCYYLMARAGTLPPAQRPGTAKAKPPRLEASNAS